MKLFTAYIILINLAAFVLMCVDKSRAERCRWRVRESVLLLFAAAGGSVGAILAMLLLEHKINKTKFKVGLPLILAAQLVLIFMIKGMAG